MSGIYGLFERHGACGREAPEMLGNAMNYWEADRRAEWRAGPMALGMHENWGTPEAAANDLELARPVGESVVALCADLRLDNRAELLRQLGPRHGLSPGDSDLEYLRCAYLEWGDDCPARLLGDFAFAIWDGRAGQLFCARDPAGIKSLYYAADDHRFTFANDMRCLRGADWHSFELDEGALFRFLVDSDLLAADRTFYSDIHRLPPAHQLVVDRSALRVARYWSPEQARPLRHRKPEDYVDEAREVLGDAVRARLRAHRPRICAHLSGGLDSGAVAGFAVRSLPADAPPLATFSWSGSPTDAQREEPEWSNALLLARSLGSDHRFVDLGVHDLARQLMDTDLTTMDAIYPWYERRVIAQAAQLDSGVLLSGWGGDELLSNPGRLAPCEWFVRGRWITLARELSRLSRVQQRARLRLFRSMVLLPVLNHYLGWVPAGERATLAARQKALLRFVDPRVRERLAPELSAPKRLGITVRSDQLSFFAHGHLASRAESWGNLGRRHKVEHRFPLLDRRVIELALGLPAELFLHQGQNRFLFRAAARGRVDDTVRLGHLKLEPERIRRAYGLLGQAVADASMALSGFDSESRRTCPLGIDFEELRGAAGRFMEGGATVASRVEAAEFRSLLNSFLVCAAGQSRDSDARCALP